MPAPAQQLIFATGVLTGVANSYQDFSGGPTEKVRSLEKCLAAAGGPQKADKKHINFCL
jgi:hypothetical protein